MDYTTKVFLLAGLVSAIGGVCVILIITKLKEIDAFYKIYDKKNKNEHEDDNDFFC